MKKILSLLLMLSLCLVLAACGNSEISETEKIDPQAVPEEDYSLEAERAVLSEKTRQTEGSDVNGTTILIAYFSRTGENYSVGIIKKGNTHIVADMISEQIGADMFEISTVTPYPHNYNACAEVAKQEQEENARPELTGSVENMEDYDIIFLGYPIWWGDMPMAVYTFLESNDFSGKTIVPFCTHEGSKLASTESSIAEICPDSDILPGLSIRGAETQNSQDEVLSDVINWLEEIGFTPISVSD